MKDIANVSKSTGKVFLEYILLMQSEYKLRIYQSFVILKIYKKYKS